MTEAGIHIGPTAGLTPGQRAQQHYLHRRGFMTITSATWRVLDAVGFDLGELRALPPFSDAEPLWRDTEERSA